MNILVCTSSNASYNSLRPEFEIYISMAKAGHAITIITHANEEWNPRFREHGISVIEAPVIKKISFKSIRLIRKTIKEKSIDIVFATNSKSIPNTTFACMGLSPKLIVYRGTDRGLYWYDPVNYLGVLHPRVDGVVCVSQLVYRYVTSIYALKNKNNVSIYKGHDVDWYNKKGTDLSEFGIEESDFTAICVTNARPHKGLHIALKAMQSLADLKNFHLLLVGKRIDKEPYISLINSSNMKSRIHLTGYRNDAPELISACKVLIQPSIAGEGLPRVILESLSSGTPVIASANGGSMEIIDDGINGCIVPVGDPDALASAIRSLYDSPENLKALADNSRNKIKNEMSHQRTVEKYIEYFESLLSQ